MEAAPDAYFRYEYPSLLDDARGEIAGLLRVPAGDVVFVPNATTAMNTVFRNLVFGKGDVIVYFSTIYSAVREGDRQRCARRRRRRREGSRSPTPSATRIWWTN